MSQGGEEHGHEKHIHVEHGHEEEHAARSQPGTTSRQWKPMSQTKWPTYIKNVGEVNDDILPLNKEINMRLYRVCSLAAWQWVSLTLVSFYDLTENDKNELFDSSIQEYIEYPEELKEKGKKLAMKIISHDWRIYKSRLVKFLSDQKNPFDKYEDLTKEDWEDLLQSVNQLTL
jgi:hypothetical protein